MKTARVNKNNRTDIYDYIRERFNYKSNDREDGKKNFVSLIDMKNVQREVQDKFRISAYQCRKITWDIYEINTRETWTLETLFSGKPMHESLTCCKTSCSEDWIYKDKRETWTL